MSLISLSPSLFFFFSQALASLTDWQRWSMLVNLLNVEGDKHEHMSDLPFGDLHLVEPEHQSTMAELFISFSMLRNTIRQIDPLTISVTRSISDGYLPLESW